MKSHSTNISTMCFYTGNTSLYKTPFLKNKSGGEGQNMSFNRYMQCVSAICEIYQQRILKLKELNWEGGKERAGRREGKNKGQITQTHLQVDCAHRSSKTNQLVYLLLKNLI